MFRRFLAASVLPVAIPAILTILAVLAAAAGPSVASAAPAASASAASASAASAGAAPAGSAAPPAPSAPAYEPASQPGPSQGADPGALAAFATAHQTSASPRVKAASAGGAVAASACYGTAHTLSPESGVTQLVVSSYGLFYDCSTYAWELDITTSDAWASSDLRRVVVYADTDMNVATGCEGFDRAVLGIYSAPDGGLIAATIVTPSCDQTTWQIADGDGLEQSAPNALRLGFLEDDLGNVGTFRWSGLLQGTSESQADVFPATGTLTETGFPTVPADNACPPGLISGLPARMAVVADPSAAARAAASLEAAGMQSVSVGAGGIVRFTGDPSIAAGALGRAGVAAQVATDRVAHYDAVPNDPLYSTEWNLPMINASAAWDITQGASSVSVADIDTGVDATHEDLQGKLTPGYDVTTGAPLAGGNTDDVGHGTAVAGVIAAATNNGVGVAGVGYNTMVTPVKLGGGEAPTTSDIIAGLNWAVANGNKIINLSLGVCGQPTLATAVQNAEQQGVLVVAAAGNQFLAGNPVQYPADYPGVIAVGAVGHDGTRAFYSETGPDIALVAPGGSADGTASDDIPVLQAGGGYTSDAGTSFASPTVAAGAALVLAADPTLTPSDAGALVVATAKQVQSSPDVNYGHGLLDMQAALTVAGRIRRAAGADRYATSVALSQLAFPNGSPTAYIASGETFADALATGALAGKQNGPILLTGACALPAGTAAELARLKPTTVYVVGGSAAVCDAVVQQVAQATGVTPTRVAGADRYATAAAIANLGWSGKSPTVYLTTGINFPDGLTGSARAALDGAPLLLSATCTLPSSTAAALSRLAPTTVKILGGTGAVCAGVVSAIAAADPGVNVIRIAGANRVDTGVKVAQDGWQQAGSVILADAGNFPDALSAGAYAALTKQPLLINDSCIPDGEVTSEIQALGATSMTVMGGPVALCGKAVAAAALGL